jgi:Ca2+/Na+ antiporter
MTKQELSQIALKILGIYALLESIQFISGVLNVFSFRGDAPFERSLMVLSMVVPFLILLWAGTFLIRRADRITSKYFPSGSIDNVDLKGSQIQAIAFSIIGAVLIVTTIPKLSQLGVNIYSLMRRADKLGAKFELERDTIGFGINLLSRFILGVLLFISGNSISNLWRRITDRIKYEANIT